MATDIPSVQFRPGRDLLVELEARGSSINLVAKRMCERYLEMVAEHPTYAAEDAGLVQACYEQWRSGELFTIPTIDAYERAHVLVERDGFTVAEALVAVGLVQKGTA